MSRFWREGYYRTSKFQNEHWVEGHWVERDNWDRSINGRYDPAQLLKEARVGRSFSACFVVPNATCPVCGAPVFFYQNDHGSRVYFDEIGDPWPKHPCTSGEVGRPADKNTQPGRVEPVARSDEDISAIHEWVEAASSESQFDFQWKYGVKPWTLTKMIRRIRGSSGIHFILKELTAGKARIHLMFRKSLPRGLMDGTIVLLQRNNLSFFDRVSMAPRKLDYWRFKSASTFISDIVAGASSQAAE